MPPGDLSCCFHPWVFLVQSPSSLPCVQGLWLTWSQASGFLGGLGVCASWDLQMVSADWAQKIHGPVSACILKRREKYLSDLRFILMRTLKHQVKLFAKSPQWLPTMCPKARLIPNPDRHSWPGSKARLRDAAAPLFHSKMYPQLPSASLNQALPVVGQTHPRARSRSNS